MGFNLHAKESDLTQRAQRGHRVHREEKPSNVKGAGPSAPVKDAGRIKRASLRTEGATPGGY